MKLGNTDEEGRELSAAARARDVEQLEQALAPPEVPSLTKDIAAVFHSQQNEKRSVAMSVTLCGSGRTKIFGVWPPIRHQPERQWPVGRTKKVDAAGALSRTGALGALFKDDALPWIVWARSCR